MAINGGGGSGLGARVVCTAGTFGDFLFFGLDLVTLLKPFA